MEKTVGAGCPEAKTLGISGTPTYGERDRHLFRNAPAVLYVAAENAWDADLPPKNMELTAVSQGLGMLYNGYLVRSTMLSVEAQEILCLREKPVTASMLLGYPNVRYIRYCSPPKTGRPLSMKNEGTYIIFLTHIGEQLKLLIKRPGKSRALLIARVAGRLSCLVDGHLREGA